MESLIYDVTGQEHFAFGVRDGRGREIGALVFRIRKDDGRPGYKPQATRDGRKYGATAREIFFTTEPEREAGIQKYLAGAKKRAAARAVAWEEGAQ